MHVRRAQGTTEPERVRHRYCAFAHASPMYYVCVSEQKEARALNLEIRGLQSEVAVLKTRSLPPDEAAQADSILREAAVERAELLAVARSRQLQVAQAQALHSDCLGDQQSHPLHTRIRLMKDWGERAAMLMGIRDAKLRTAYEYVMGPSRLVDVETAQISDNRFETAQGDICCVHHQTVLFHGVNSLQQVYDALLFYYTNNEISISERLGHITVRDDYDSIDGNIYNSRVISKNDEGITIEASTLVFSKLVAANEVDFGEKPCGMVVIDCVDEDELYPYVPSERVRWDGSGAIVLTASRMASKANVDRPKNPSARGDGEMVVTMRRAAFLKLHRPYFPVPEAALQQLQDGIACWGDVMLKTIRSMVYATDSQASK